MKGSPIPANKSAEEICLLKAADLRTFYGTLPMNDVMGFHRARLTTLEGTNIRAGIVWLPIGQESPPHDSGSEHIFFLLEGALEFVIEERNYQMQPHDMFYVPAGTTYLYRNVGQVDVRFLNILGKVGAQFRKGKYYLENLT